MVIKPLNEYQLGSARINADFEKNVIRLNQPERNSNARMWRVHTKLTAMLSALHKESEYVFGSNSAASMKSTYMRTRKRLTLKLQNPRLQQIGFHTRASSHTRRSAQKVWT